MAKDKTGMRRGLSSRTVLAAATLTALFATCLGGVPGCGTGIYQDFTNAIDGWGCCCDDDDCDDCNDCGGWYDDGCYYGDCGGGYFGFGFFDGWYGGDYYDPYGGWWW